MVGKRFPSRMLFPHTADHYQPDAYTKGMSGRRTAPTYPSDPTNDDFRCFVQPAVSSVVVEFQQRGENVTHSIYIQSQTVFDAINADDRLVFDSTNYNVRGKRDSDELDKVFRVDVDKED